MHDKRILYTDDLNDVASYRDDLTYQGAYLRNALPASLRKQIWDKIKGLPDEQNMFRGFFQQNDFLPKEEFDPLLSIDGLIPYALSVARAIACEKVDRMSFGIFVNVTRMGYRIQRFKFGNCVYDLGPVSHAMMNFGEDGEPQKIEWIVPEQLSDRQISHLMDESPRTDEAGNLQHNIAQVEPGDLLVMRSQSQGRNSLHDGVINRISGSTSEATTISMVWVPKIK